MKTIKSLINIYHSKIDYLDLELLIASAINKPREFVLANPDHELNRRQELQAKSLIARRRRSEPIAYILGQKEFYGLSFKVDKSTLIPRPETELIVEEVLKLNPKSTTIIDVGTGSGNIIVSLAKNLKSKNKFIAFDVSEKALAVAKKNAKTHKVERRIKFIKSNLLGKMIEKRKTVIVNSRLLILANLPYLSRNIYSHAGKDIKKYEPKSALLSGKNGLSHYERLLKQIKALKNRCCMLHVSCFMEISPEQKRALQKLISRFFPKTKPAFYKDLSGRWRACRIDLP